METPTKEQMEEIRAWLVGYGFGNPGRDLTPQHAIYLLMNERDILERAMADSGTSENNAACVEAARKQLEIEQARAATIDAAFEDLSVEQRTRVKSGLLRAGVIL